jgi:hypothetical protein
MIVIAHAGHWLVQVLYAVPLLIMVGFLLVGRFRQQREMKRTGGAPPKPPDDSA